MKACDCLLSFEAMLAPHPNIKPCSSGYRSDSGLVYDIVDKTHTIDRAEIFLSAVACFHWLNMYVAGQNEIQSKMKFLCLLTLIIHGS